MLSRVADSIYWFNRYVERAENYARFIDVNYNLSLELPPDIPQQWMPLIATSGDLELFEKLYDKQDRASVIRFLGFDKNYPNSVYNCITFARENARSVRPEITKEVWEQINEMYFYVKDASAKKTWQKKDPRVFFNNIKKGCHLLYGIFDATISRNDGWHFGTIGRLIERADKTSRILDVKYHIILPTTEDVGSAFDIIQWAALLKSVSAYDMYRKYSGNLNTGKIVEFLVLNKFFPRSVIRCINQIETSLKFISGYNISDFSSNAEKIVGNIRSEMENMDINDIFKMGLHQYLDDIQVNLNNISNEIFENYFSKKQLVK